MATPSAATGGGPVVPMDSRTFRRLVRSADEAQARGLDADGLTTHQARVAEIRWALYRPMLEVLTRRQADR